MSTADNNGAEAQACLNEECAFTGSSSYGGFCSVCYKTKMSEKSLGLEQAPKQQQQQQQQQQQNNDEAESKASATDTEGLVTKSETASDSESKEPPSTTADAETAASAEVKVKDADADAASASAEGKGEDEDEDKVPERPVQKKRHRCWECKKKVGLTGIECRCEYVFCGKCRYPDAHSCDFDHAARDRSYLEKRNAKVLAQKVETL